MRRVAILGIYPGQRYDEPPTAFLVPPQSEGWEHWRLNMPHPTGNPPIADRWFQLHERFSLEPSEEAWLSVCPFPLYTFWPWPGESIKDNRVYPLDDVLKMPGVRERGFFACSFAYMIALAVLEGVDEIGCYGVELPMGSARERLVENASVCWWLGYAAGRGIRVTVPEASTLLEYPYLYGYQYDDEVQFVNDRVDSLVSHLRQRRKV